MKKNIKNYTVINKILIILLFGLSGISANASEPLWIIEPASGNNPTQTVPKNQTATIQYLIKNQSAKFKTLVPLPIQGVVPSGSCSVAPRGQANSSCVLSFTINGSTLPPSGIHSGPIICQANANGSPNSNQCYQPSSANSLNIASGPPSVFITANPAKLEFTEEDSGEVLITNNLSSEIPAQNITAMIPAASNITVLRSTCAPSLAAGAQCIITLYSDTAEGPTVISFKGENTNTQSTAVTVTPHRSLAISVTNPDQANRVIAVSEATPLSLEITNEDSTYNAKFITVNDQSECPNIQVDSTACTNLSPGGSCLLQLSSNTPYMPCVISIKGSNTDEVAALISFSYLEGLVIQESGGSGKIISNSGFTGRWSYINNNIIGANSLDDGVANTNLIVASTYCTTYPNDCAALVCRTNYGADWYLPAPNELEVMRTALCPNAEIPCDFGNFVAGNYWSSSQGGSSLARYMIMPLGTTGSIGKANIYQVRCMRAFP